MSTALELAAFKDIPGINHGFGFAKDSARRSTWSTVHQVHSAAIVQLPRSSTQSVRADGLITSGPETVAVQTADCIPVLFSSKDGRAVAAVHAGWRGLCAGILVNAVRDFESLGVRSAELLVGIGPHARACCYEVDQITCDSFEKQWGRFWMSGINGRSTPWSRAQRPNPSSPSPRGGGLWISLETIARLQLEDVGVTNDRIHSVGICTYCSDHPLASYRRSTHRNEDRTGRQWSFIGKRVD